MRAIIVLAMLLATHLAAAQEVGSHWKFDDGTGSATVRDYGPNKLNGTILDAAKCTWAREDDRGFFLNFSGGSVRVPNHLKLILEGGFVLETRFSVDLDAIASTNFAALVTKGNKFQEGYSVMVRRNGDLLINLRGPANGYKITPLGLKSNTDYRLRITVGDGKVIIELDGKKAAEYEIKGKLSVLGRPLHFGSIEHYPFTGNLYEVKLYPYGDATPKEAAAKAARTTGEVELAPDFRQPPPVDPPGTVILDDFTRLVPEPIYGGAGSHRREWRFRTDLKTPQSRGMLHPPMDLGGAEAVIPHGLTGRYDVYVGVRAVGTRNLIQLRFDPSSDTYYTIQTLPVKRHRTIEVPVGRNIDLSDGKVYLASNGGFYFSYLKFIPVANRRAVEIEADPAAGVSTGPRRGWAEKETANRRRIEQRIAEGYFVERTYVEEKAAPAPTPAAAARGYLLFPWHWMNLLFPVSVPERDSATLQLNAALTPGEYEPVSFGVRPLREIKKLSLRQSAPFRAAGGREAKIDAAVYQVRDAVKRLTNFMNKSEFMTVPLYLEAFDTVTLSAGESRQFWITVKAPENTPPGKYRAEFELAADGKVEKIPFELEVYPFKLEKPVGYEFGFSMQIDSLPQTAANIRAMAEHGMTGIWLGEGWFDYIRGDTAETMHLDLETSPMPTVARQMRDSGMTGTMIIRTSLIHTAVLKLPKEKQFETYRRMIGQIETMAKAENWPARFYTSYDEVLSEPHHLANYECELHWQKQLGLTIFNDHIWYKTARPYQKEVDRFVDLIDVFANRYNNRKFWYVDSWETMQDECARRGKKLMAYNSNNAVTFTQPAGMRFSGGWFFRTVGDKCIGQNYYTYNLSFDDPYNDLDDNYADWQYIYPAWGGRKGGPAIDFEAYREGIDDLRYILTLEAAVAEAAKRGDAAGAAAGQKVLAELRESFDLDRFRKESLFVSPKWDRSWTEEGKRFAAGEFNLPNGWSFEDYDNARKKIAAEIIKLQMQR